MFLFRFDTFLLTWLSLALFFLSANLAWRYIQMTDVLVWFHYQHAINCEEHRNNRVKKKTQNQLGWRRVCAPRTMEHQLESLLNQIFSFDITVVNSTYVLFTTANIYLSFKYRFLTRYYELLVILKLKSHHLELSKCMKKTEKNRFTGRLLLTDFHSIQRHLKTCINTGARFLFFCTGKKKHLCGTLTEI